MSIPEALDAAAELPPSAAAPAATLSPSEDAAEPEVPESPAHVLSMEAAENAVAAADASVAQVVQRIFPSA
ncbi:hypothetical protein [Roseateles sp. LKC17W]|uniref:Uncharacterized protein n=1 Tax=Pelomonas margarita TaxID=3299031 RepID=A0ABW7FCQ5_9BURK